MSWRIDLCTDWQKVAEVEALEQFNAIVNHLAVGSWRLDAPLVGLGGADIDVVDSVQVWFEDRLMFSGFIGGPSGGVTISESGDGRRVLLEGVDVWGVLANRSAFPDPATPEPWAASHDVRTGVASTVAAAYINANMGSSALLARQIPGLTVVDAASGMYSTWSARLQPLSELIARICADGGITCRPTALEDGTIRIELRSQADRSLSLILSDQGDLTDTQWVQKPTAATWVLGAGQGELTARTFRSSTSGATGLARIEQVYEHTNITTSAELDRAALTQREMAAASTTVSTRLTTAAAQRFEYGVDYDIGDIVGVELDNVRYAVPVQSVSIEITPEAQVVVPVLGVATPDRLTRLLADVDGLSERLDRQVA